MRDESFYSKKFPLLVTTKPILFPGRRLPILVKRKRGLVAIEKSMSQDKYLIVVPTREDVISEEQDLSQISSVGVLARIEHCKGTRESGFQTLIRAEERVFLKKIPNITDTLQNAELFEGEIDVTSTEFGLQSQLIFSEEQLSHFRKKIYNSVLRVFQFFPGDSSEQKKMMDSARTCSDLLHYSLEQIPLLASEKLSIFGELQLDTQVERLVTSLEDHVRSLETQSKVQEKVNSKLMRSQRETLLREQLSAIKEELGETEENAESKSLEQRLLKLELPTEVRSVVDSELQKLKSMNPMSPDANVTKTYLETISQLPWGKEEGEKLSESIDLKKAREVLDEQHFGLSKIKTRIVEHLAILKLKGNSSNSANGTSLILLGPPGVGKTSLAASIAQAMGKKLIRVALGGVRDESDIRGHRRTYVGAMPGRIIQALKRAGTKKPVMLLDEIDKLSRGFSGDPGAALLEVLDPEQNKSFVDHYLDVPFDLSEVSFIATANSLETIPGPLLDRLEIISLSGYSQEEKKEIAMRHVLGKQFEATGVSPDSVEFPKSMIEKIISGHTRESGVRDLSRKIQSVLRYLAPSLIEKNTISKLIVNDEILEAALGAKRYIGETLERNPVSGLVTGLAWTPVGGEVLFIEVSQMPGHGKLTLTGQMGDVMKESAQLAFSLVRTKLYKLLSSVDFDKIDLHVHIPAGAVPKDGPSAGITLTLALASCLLNKTVSPEIALTGEVSLRGAVLPVGGIKEKLLAAQRAGVKKVILSERNKPDVKEVNSEISENLEIIYVNQIDEVFENAFQFSASEREKLSEYSAAKKSQISSSQFSTTF